MDDGWRKEKGSGDRLEKDLQSREGRRKTSAALVANQQSMIGCLETEVRLLCEPERLVPEV